MCLEKEGKYRFDVLDIRRKELVALGNAIKTRDVKNISKHVNKALDSGASFHDIKKLVEHIIGDKRLLLTLIELQKAISFGESSRKNFISVIDDCREM